MHQNEPDLIRAVNQLCDGCPDKQTEALLKGLRRELDDDEDVCRLYGTNFDATYVNQLYLDELDGEMFTYKATDKGKVSWQKINKNYKGKIQTFHFIRCGL